MKNVIIYIQYLTTIYFEHIIVAIKINCLIYFCFLFNFIVHYMPIQYTELRLGYCNYCSKYIV